MSTVLACAFLLNACLVQGGGSLSAAETVQGLGEPGKAIRLAAVVGGSEAESQITLNRGDRAQIIATAHFDSGQLRDWTRKVVYRADPAGVVSVDSQGLITPLADGAAVVQVGGEGLSASVKVEVRHFAHPPQVNFTDRISPLLTKFSCNGGGCHGKSGGQNGFALSLLGFEPADDYDYLVKEGFGRRLFPAAPDRSLLLLKATAAVPHGGGMRISRDSDEYAELRLWIEQGMPFGSDDDPVMESISVYPKQVIMPLDGEQQLQVLAHYSDGSIRDVTRQADYTANNRELGDCGANGLMTALGQAGDVAIMVRYLGQVAAFRATIPRGAPVDQLPPVRNVIDGFVFDKLKDLGLPPSPVCDDSTFIRRVTLDIAGRLPTFEETQAFLADAGPNKRADLVDRLVDSDAYADYFSQKWAAILRNKVDPQVQRDGNFRFHDWVRTHLNENRPYNELIREVVTASGNEVRNPAVNWHRQVKSVEEKVEDTAQVFLGLRIQCARCHHHPFEKWSQDDYWGMAAFYSNTREKPGQKVYAIRGIAQSRHPKTQALVRPKPLGEETLELTADDDARVALADWLASKENPFVAKALVNRYWKHFFGVGIVDPEDDMRATNPASNEPLLNGLAEHFIKSNFDLKDLVRTICKSSVYQLDSIPNDYNASDRQAYSRFYPRRMPAEVMLDSIDALCGSQTRFTGLPAGMRAVQIPDHGGVNNGFLNAFGRPAGASACECERNGEMSMQQSLQLLNSDDIYNKLVGSRAQQLATDPRSDEEKIEELYLRALSRPAKETERTAFLAHLAKFEANQKRGAYEDILWTLINTKEFLFNH
ncbi:DUF1549 and DUF1553 domain-containing protein [Lignipirellula cremea]|nr:DUF1549 and DUF1553 domain-containing protein [Lignipirellula cremea]